MESIKPKTFTKSELAKLYAVDYKTFMSWVKSIPNLELTPRQKTLKPIQVKKIFDSIGEP